MDEGARLAAPSEENVMKVYLNTHPILPTDVPELIHGGHDEKQARQAAAQALHRKSLRGLRQAPTRNGVRYYSPGATYERGMSVDIFR